MTRPQLAFFTRLLDDVPAAERYRLATEQIRHAEGLGFDSAWVAQHHFHEREGGLPSPLVFLAAVAAATSRIRLGTGIITLGMEDPVRVAEDAAVADLISGGRLELGLGTGGTPSSFGAFGASFAERRELFDRKLAVLDAALGGDDLGDGNRLYPAAGSLARRIWFATFSAPLAVRAGQQSRGLQLSRTQPRPDGAREAPLWGVQNPLIDAYLDALPTGATPRISVARTLFISDDPAGARRLAVAAYRSQPIVAATIGTDGTELDDDELLARLDVHVGGVDEVTESLAADTALARATQVSFQVHSIDPPHELILRSTELLATVVAPRLGWGTTTQRKEQP
ncbi:putative FMN-dependent luciferase-like monooxygenase [Mycetocola reblochoni]|uniref:Alkanal monooxygenase alpha chain n=2 Tax=Mycetocola reblochoni TaxID=331618 RepID=A0A1R4K651_9MICO|nr:putative FMN-dependent luciferase-like monooxygenase [Mycetocola reblochoni]RLP68011.1 putative FMN-dependent luciferase-like monooxygenase [Mycetocola reblochoni]SJN39674.1 Alkanal monooxygenase alpha chain [Mycetocola reblochoni REB411]